MHPSADANAPAREMPRYQSHKRVWALKIARIESLEAGCRLHFADDGYAPMVFDWWASAENTLNVADRPAPVPEAGGYYVAYDDGYKSFSPAKAFEEGYTRL